jgi:uncharacterized protein (UPF0332 family)
MSFDPKTFINISKELDAGDSEAHIRSLVNRAYYAAYGHIKDNIQDRNYSSNCHQELIAKLKGSAIPNYRKIGSRLETLFKKRKDADYHYDITFRKDAYLFIINESETIIKHFDEEIVRNELD